MCVILSSISCVEFLELGSNGFLVGAKHIVDVRSVGVSWNPEEGKARKTKGDEEERKLNPNPNENPNPKQSGRRGLLRGQHFRKPLKASSSNSLD